MPRTNLTDLNEHLFDCLERLLDDDNDLSQEVQRAKAVSQVASVIVSNADLALRSCQYASEVDAVSSMEVNPKRRIPEMLDLKN